MQQDTISNTSGTATTAHTNIHEKISLCRGSRCTYDICTHLYCMMRYGSELKGKLGSVSLLTSIQKCSLKLSPDWLLGLGTKIPHSRYQGRKELDNIRYFIKPFGGERRGGGQGMLRYSRARVCVAGDGGGGGGGVVWCAVCIDPQTTLLLCCCCCCCCCCCLLQLLLLLIHSPCCCCLLLRTTLPRRLPHVILLPTAAVLLLLLLLPAMSTTTVVVAAAVGQAP